MMSRRSRFLLTILFAVSLGACPAPSDDEIETIVSAWYADSSPFSGLFEIEQFTCMNTEQTGSVLAVDTGYGFCRPGECPLLAGHDNRVFTLANEGWAWEVVDEGEFLNGACAEGRTSSPTEDLLTSRGWRWVEAYDPDTDTTYSMDGDVWQFAPTSEGNGNRLINGSGTDDTWFLSETTWTEWTLSETYELFLVLDGADTMPYTYGVRAISETNLELHHDVGVASNRIDRFTAE